MSGLPQRRLERLCAELRRHRAAAVVTFGSEHSRDGRSRASAGVETSLWLLVCDLAGDAAGEAVQRALHDPLTQADVDAAARVADAAPAGSPA